MKAEKAPRHLKPATRAWWEHVVATYELDQHHVRLLTLAGEAWDRCAQARAILDKKGLTFEDRWGAPKPRPEAAIERDSRIGFSRLLRELDLDLEAPKAEAKRPPALRAITGGRAAAVVRER